MEIKLKQELKYNHLHFLAFNILLFIISLIFKPFFIILFIYNIYLIKNYYNYILTIILFFFIIINILIINFKSNNLHNKIIDDNIKIIEEKDYYYFVKYRNYKLIIYNKNNNYHFNVGDKIKVKGICKKIHSNKIDYLFNYENYYKSINTYYYLDIYNYEKIKNEFHLNKIKNNIIKYLNKRYSLKNANYLKTILFSTNDFDDETFDIYKNLNLFYLLSVNGLNIYFFISLLKKIKIKDKYINIILFLYLIINHNLITFKVILMYYLKQIFKDKFTNLDILSIVFILYVILNPYIVYNNSFKFSFLISFFIMIKNNKLNLNIYILMIIFPLMINNINKINPFLIIINIFISFIYKYILLFTYLLLIFPFLNNLGLLIYSNLESLLKIFSEISLYITFPNLNIYEIIIYYLFLFYLFKKFNFKKLLIYFLLIFIFNIKNNINPIGEVYYMDVGQGNTTLISLPYKKCNILIDIYSNSYEYLLKKNIKKLNYLFITHSDYDHIGSINDLLNNVKVDNIVVSKYDDYDLFKKLDNVIYSKTDDNFTCSDININILGPINKYSDLNNNSLIIKFKIYNETFLFAGDAEEEEEKDLVDKYQNKLKSDYLLLSHHGSNTSSIDSFIKYVNPQVAIISCGYENKFNFPHKETINTLNKYQVKYYLTSDNSYRKRIFKKIHK